MKGAAILLGVLVVLFVYAIVRPEPDGRDSRPDWTERWSRRLQVPFYYERISSGCFDRSTRTFRATVSCPGTVAAGPPQPWYRPWPPEYNSITLTTPTPGVKIAFAPGAGSRLPEMSRTLKSQTQEEKVVIPLQGGQLVITCPAPTIPCAVRVD